MNASHHGSSGAYFQVQNQPPALRLWTRLTRTLTNGNTVSAGAFSMCSSSIALPGVGLVASGFAAIEIMFFLFFILTI